MLPLLLIPAWAGPSSTTHPLPQSSLLSVVDALPVASKVEWELVVQVGPEGLAPGDQIRIDDPTFHGLRWSRWGDLSPHADDCTALDTSPTGMSWGQVSVQGAHQIVRSNCEGPSCVASPHVEASTTVTVEEPLVGGEELVITVGSTAPDCGFQTPTRAFQNVPVQGWERLGDALDWTPLQPIAVDFVAAAPTQVVAFAPSVVALGESFDVTISLLDLYGNPADVGTESLTIDGQGISVTESTLVLPWHTEEEGVLRIPVTWNQRTILSNPVRVEPAPAQFVYWGDIHSHHGHSAPDHDGVWRNQNHGYARDVLGLDVASETQKAGDTEIDADELWSWLQRACADDTADGAFVPLLGFEWMGESVGLGIGHHNIYWDSCDAPRGLHDAAVISHVDGEDGLWSWVGAQGFKAVAVPHATLFTGHYLGESSLQQAIEVFSGWGNSLAEGDGSVLAFLSAGQHLGFVASSDNHEGWMGNQWRETRSGEIGSGLTAFLAPELTREAIHQALEQQRTYATTGARILVDINASGGALQSGSHLGPTSFSWAVHGTNVIDRVTLWSIEEGGAAPVAVAEHPVGKLDTTGSAAIRPETHTAVWLEVVQRDRQRAWSTPIWVAPAEASESTGTDAGCGCGAGPQSWAWVLGSLALWRRRR